MSLFNKDFEKRMLGTKEEVDTTSYKHKRQFVQYFFRKEYNLIQDYDELNELNLV